MFGSPLFLRFCSFFRSEKGAENAEDCVRFLLKNSCLRSWAVLSDEQMSNG